MQRDAERQDLGGGVLPRRRATGTAAPAHRARDLLHKADLAVGGGAERSQVPGFDAVRRQGARRAGDGQRGLAVVTRGVAAQQAERGELGERRLVQPRGLPQLGRGQPQ